MASSTRSRKTRKSRANAHMPGAARVRPRIQLVLSPKIQTNTDPIINTNNNNLVTPHVPSAATEASKSTSVVSGESLTTSEVKGDDKVNKMSRTLSEVREPFSASTSLHATKQQEQQHNNTINPLDNTNNNENYDKVESSYIIEMAKPSLESQSHNSTLHVQNKTEVENKCHDVNISNDSNHNIAKKGDDKHKSVNVSPENKATETTMTESETKLPISNKRVMTAIKAQRSKLHQVHTINTKQQHHNTSNAFYQTANIDSQKRVTNNVSKVSIDKKEKNAKSVEKRKCVEDVYANAQTIYIEIPPAPPAQPSLQSFDTNMSQQKESNIVNMEIHNLVENGNTSSNSNNNSYENDVVKDNMESRQGTSTIPMTHTNITSVPSHLTDTDTVNTVNVEKDIGSDANTHAKHISEAEHVSDEHSVKSLQKEQHHHQQKQRNQKRMMRKRSNASRMKRDNSYTKESIATAVTSANSNNISVSCDKPMKENITIEEQSTQKTASQALTNNNSQKINITEQRENEQNESWQSQNKKNNTTTFANTDTMQTEFSKTPNVKEGKINQKVKVKLTLLEDINKETNPVQSSSAADITHARATINKTNLLKKRKLFPQQTEVNNDNNNNNVNSDSKTINAEEVKITDSKHVQEEKEKKYLLKSEKEDQHNVSNANTNVTSSLVTQQSEQPMEQLQKEKLIAKANTSQNDNLNTAAESVNVKEEILEGVHNTPSSVSDKNNNNTKNNNNNTLRSNNTSVNDNSTMAKPVLRTGRANMTKVITKRMGKEHKLNELHTIAPAHNKETNNNNTISDSNHITNANDDKGKNVENSASPLETVKDVKQLHLQQEEPNNVINSNEHKAMPSQEHVTNKINEHIEVKAEDNEKDAMWGAASKNSNNYYSANDNVTTMNETLTTTVNESVETNANSLSQESNRLRFFVELDEPSTTSQSANAETGAPSSEIHVNTSQNMENMNVTYTHSANLPDQKTSTPVQGIYHRMHKVLDKKRLQSKVIVKEEQQQIENQNENVEPNKRVGAVMMKAQAGKLRHRITTQTIPSTSTSISTNDHAASSQEHFTHVTQQQEQQQQKIVANHANEKANKENKNNANVPNDNIQSTQKPIKLEEVLQSTPHSFPTQETKIEVQANDTTSAPVQPDTTKVSTTHENNDLMHTHKSGKKNNVNTKRALHSKRRVATKLEQLSEEQQDEQNALSPQEVIQKAATKVVEAAIIPQPQPYSHSSPMGYIAAHPDITDVTVINRIRKRQEMERKLRKARRTWLEQQRNINTSEGDDINTQAVKEGTEIREENKMINEIRSNNHNINSSDKIDNHTTQMQEKVPLSQSKVNHIMSSESNTRKQKGNDQVEQQTSNATTIHHQDIAPQEKITDENEMKRSNFDEVNNNIASTQEHAEDVTMNIVTATQTNTVNTHQSHEQAPQEVSTSKLANHNVHFHHHTIRVMQKCNVKKSKHHIPSPAPQEAHDNTSKLCNDKAADTNINIDCIVSQIQSKGTNNKNSFATYELISNSESNNNNTENSTQNNCSTPEKQKGKEKLPLSDEEELQEQQQHQQTLVQNEQLNELSKKEKNDNAADNVERVNVNSTNDINNADGVASIDAVNITDKETTLKNLAWQRKKAKKQLAHSPSSNNKHKRKNRNKHKTASAKQKEQQYVEVTQKPILERTTIKESVSIEDHESSNKDKNDLESKSKDDALLQERQHDNESDIKEKLGMHETDQPCSQLEQPQEQQNDKVSDISTSALNDKDISQANNNNDETLVEEENKEPESKEPVVEQHQQEKMENVQMEMHGEHAEKHKMQREQEQEHLQMHEVQNEVENNSEVKETEEQLSPTNTSIRKKRFFTELEPSSTLLPELGTQENVKLEELRNVASINDTTDNTISLEQDIHAETRKKHQQYHHNHQSRHQQSINVKSKTHHTSNQINNEFMTTSDDIDNTNTTITTDRTTHSYTDNNENEIEDTSDSHNDVLTQNRSVAESYETVANDNDYNKGSFEEVNPEPVIGVISNESSEMSLEQNINVNDNSDNNDITSETNEAELCVQHNVETSLPPSSSSAHVQSLHEPEAQEDTIPFALRHFSKKIMKMMKLNKKRVNVLTEPDNNDASYANAEEDKVEYVDKNNNDVNTTRSENSDVNSMHNEECTITTHTSTVTNHFQVNDHQGDVSEIEVKSSVNAASPLEQAVNKRSLESEQHEEQQEWKELQEQELEVEKQHKQEQELQEHKLEEQEQQKVTELYNKEEGDAAVSNTDNIANENIISTEEILTPQVLRRLSAKRKIKKHAELAAARRKGKIDAIKNKRIQQETENANGEYTPPPEQQQNEDTSNSDAKFLHHKRKSNLKELDALSQINHLIHCTEENTSMPSHINTIGATKNNNNASAGVIDYTNISSNSPIIKPALHPSEEMLLNKFALPLPSGNVLLEEFNEKEMLLRRNSLEVPWEVGLRFD